MNLHSSSSDSFHENIGEAHFCEMHSLGGLLNKLTLPEVVSEESVAEIITVCILKKAFVTPSRWSKWILLAALEELLGRRAPILDEAKVKDLQNDCKLSEVKINVKDLSWFSSLVEDDAVVSSERNQQHDVKIPDHSFSSSNTLVGNRSLSSNYLQKNSYLNNNNNNNTTGISNHKGNLHNELPLKSNIKKVDVGIQCSPEVMGVMRNKRLRIKPHCKPLIPHSNHHLKTEVSTQTSQTSGREETESNETKNCFTQTEVTLMYGGERRCMASWHLTEVSGINAYKKLKSSEKYSNLKNEEMPIKVFYGRPLIGAKSKLETPVIPLESLLQFSDSETTSDPRRRVTLVTRIL